MCKFSIPDLPKQETYAQISMLHLDSVVFAVLAIAVAFILEVRTRERSDKRQRWLKSVDAAVFIIYISLEIFALLQASYCLLFNGLIFEWIALRAFGWGAAATVLYLLLESKESTLKDGLKSAWEFAFVLPASIVTLYCVFGIQVPASAS